MFKDRLLQPKRPTQVAFEPFDRSQIKTKGRVGKKSIGFTDVGNLYRGGCVVLPPELLPPSDQ